MSGGDPSSPKKKDATTLPVSKEIKNQKGKTVYQKQAEKEHGKGVTALDIVKKNIKKKHGKGAIMGEGKDLSGKYEKGDKPIKVNLKDLVNKAKNNPKNKNLGVKPPTDTEDVTEAKSAAWQRKAGKSESGGLNAKGVASYRCLLYTSPSPRDS